MLDLFVQSNDPPPAALVQWREAALQRLLQYAALMLIPVAVALVLGEFTLDPVVQFAPLFVLLGLFQLFAGIRRTDLNLRVGLLVAFGSLFAAVYLLFEGFTPPGVTAWMATLVIAATFLSAAAALRIWVAGSLLLLLLGIALRNHWLILNWSAQSSLSNVLILILAGGFCTLLVSSLVDRLAESLSAAEQSSNALEQIVATRTAELRAALSEHHRLQEAVGAMPVGLALIGSAAPDYPLHYANNAFEQLFGSAQGLAFGTASHELLAQGVPALASPIAAALADERPFAATFRLDSAAEPPAWRRLTLAPVGSAGEPFSGFVIILSDVSESLHAQAALANREAMLRAIGDNLPGGMLYQYLEPPERAEWRFSYVSSGVRRRFAVDPSDVYRDPETLLTIILPEDRVALRKAAALARKQGSELNIELRRIQPDGTIGWSTLRASAIPHAAGGLIWHGIEFDITSRKQAEEDLARQFHYAEVLAQCSRALLVADAEGDRWSAATVALEQLRRSLAGDRLYVYCNLHDPVHGFGSKLVAETRGSDVPVFPHRNWLSWSPTPERLLQTLEQGVHIGGPVGQLCPDAPAYQELLANAGIRSLLLMPIHVDGRWWGYIGVSDLQQSRLWDEACIRLMRTVAEMISAFVAVGDRTYALRESERRYRVIAEHLPDTVLLMFDRDLQIKLLAGDHRHSTPQFGLSAEGRPLADLYPGDIAALLTPHYRAGLSGAPQRFEYRSLGRTIAQQVIPLQRSDGAIEGIMVVSRDVTAEREIEAMLRRGKEAAESADRAKSLFLAHMSHEIRTPLNAVTGMAGLLLDTNLNPEQRAFVETIQTGGRSLLALVNNILDLSKISAGELTLIQEPFDLLACIEDAIDLLAYDALARGIDLRYTIEPDTPRMLIGDVDRLRQIILNLLGNALKFTERGWVALHLGCADQASALETPQMRLITIAVSDSGIGIGATALEQIFEPFVQADQSNTRRYSGTGLGLPISRQIVQRMGGSLEALSEPGVGSTFTLKVRLPVSHASPPDELSLAGRRLLLVSDEALNRSRTAVILARFGIELAVCTDVASACTWLASGQQADVALLDIRPQQPHVFAQVRKLREMAPGMPLLRLAGAHAPLNVEDRGLFVATIGRPIRRSQLAVVLHSVLQNADAGHAQPPDLMALKVLCVEDNLINQQVMQRLLRRMGYQADLVADGVAALAAVKQVDYDIVLMDVQMPLMDGEEATRHIRALGTAIRQPYIIAITASALVGDRERYLEAGMDAYLTKPLVFDDLQQMMSRHDQLSQAVRPAPASIDWRVLADLTTGFGPEYVEMLALLVQVFAEEMPLRVADLADAVEQDNHVRRREIAHKIRGGALQLGAVTVAQLAQQLESDQATRPYNALIAELRLACQVAVRELQAGYRSLGGALTERS
ncbi:MAG: response regulator [Oscillochloris sp.]|nr:response regulator [Oscillochloris sp.]